MFKAGDKVKRIKDDNDYQWRGYCKRYDMDDPYTVLTVLACDGSHLELYGLGSVWIMDRFELVKDEIQVGDVYKDGNGNSVRIISTDRVTINNKCPIVGLVTFVGEHNECVIGYCVDGSYCGDLHNMDLILPWAAPKVPKVDWSTVPVDTLVQLAGIETPSYFSNYADGIVRVFMYGASSKTNRHGTQRWEWMATECSLYKE